MGGRTAARAHNTHRIADTLITVLAVELAVLLGIRWYDTRHP